MKTLKAFCYRTAALAALYVALFTPRAGWGASAAWLASPTDANWITTSSETNWSTGGGTWPGGTSTSSGDTATFNIASSFTTIVIGGTWNIKNITFDTANCAAYTITNNGAGTARLTGNGTIQLTSSVTQPQLITGSQLRLHTTGACNLLNNSATPTATLTVSAGLKANNSSETTTLDQAVNLQGSNTGSNVVSGAIVDYDSTETYDAALTKSGAGTWYLTANNTYKGPTIISGGFLGLTSSGSINSSSNVVVSSSTLSVAGTMNLTHAASIMVVTNSGTLLITNIARTPVTVGTFVATNATLRLGINGTTPFTNIVATTALSAGPGITFSIDQVANLSSSTTFALISYAGADPSAENFNVIVPTGYTASSVTVDPVQKLVTATIGPVVIASTAVWIGATNGALVSNWDLVTTNWLISGVPAAYSQFGAVQFDDTALNNTVSLTTALTPGLVQVTNSALNYAFVGSGSLSGNASLLKQGSGTLLLDNSAANTYSGGTTIADGVLQLGNADSNGTLGTGPVTNDASLVIDRSDVFTLGNVISGSGSLTKIGNGTLTLSASSGYGGQTVVNTGTLRINGILSGGGILTNAPGSTVGGAGTNTGLVDLGGTLNPGAGGTTFTAMNGLTLEPGATLKFDLNTATTPGAGVNDLINITNDLTLNNNSITVGFLSPPTLGSTYRLINYSGNLNGSFNPTVNSHYSVALDTSTPGQVNATVTGSSASLSWNSTGSSLWDNGASSNWLNQSSSASDVFYAGDTVLFDDGVANIQTNVSISSVVFPALITVNSATNYFFAGSGRISGAASLTKSGTGNLTITTSNDFTGAVNIQAGTVVVGNSNALGSWGGPAINFASGAALDLGAFTNAVPQGNPLFGARQINIAGAGPSGSGAIINSSAFNQQGALEKITLTANATFGGQARWDMRNGTVALDLAGFRLTKTGPNQISLVNVSVTSGDININQGVLSFETTSSVPQGGTVTVNPGGYLGHYRLAPGAMTRNLILNGGGTTNLATSGNPGTNDAPITLTANSILGGSTAASYPLYLNGAISESGGSFGITKASAGPVVLTAASTYSGNTLVASGALALSGSGSIANSANITVQSGATLDASARSDATFTLAAGQILGGGGAITGDVVVASAPNTVLHPGGGGTAARTLTLNSDLTFSGSGLANVTLDLSSTYNGANDQIVLNGASSVLSGQSTVITINSDGMLDITHDCVLINLTGASASISAGSFSPTPLWAGTTPRYATGYSIVVSGKQVLLHYTPIPVTPIITVANKAYDATPSAVIIGRALSGVLEGDDVNLDTGGTAAFIDQNAGIAKTVNITGLSLSGTSAPYYQLPSTTASATADISRAPLTVSAVTDTKTYDGTTNSTGVPVIAPGLFGGDTPAFAQAFDARNAGAGKTLTPSGAVNDGNGGNNYAVTFVADSAGVISARPITVTAAANSKPYDGNTNGAAIPTVTSGNLVDGDTAAFTESYDTASVGTHKTLTPAGSVKDGNSGQNYEVTFVADTSGVISGKALTLTGITAVDKVYDGTNTATISTNSLAFGGLLAGDDVVLVTNGYTAEFASSGADTNITVTVTGLSLSGVNAGDYALEQPSGLTADITPATLTVTGIIAKDKVHDGTDIATLDTTGAALVGVVSKDIDEVFLDTTGAVGTFADPSVGASKLVTISGLMLAGSVATNYSLVQPTATASITDVTLVAPQILSQKSPGPGNFELTFSGPNGQTYRVLTTTDARTSATNWIVLATGTFGADPVSFTDSSATNAAQFYRVSSP